jgi:hypothetical protein
VYSRFPSSTIHLFLNETTTAIISQKSLQTQTWLNTLHSTIFPTLHFIEPEVKTAESDKLIKAKPFLRYRYRPQKGLHWLVFHIITGQCATCYSHMYSIQHYVIKFVSDLQQVSGFLWVLQIPAQYNWNIVESGIKHHNPNPCMFQVLFPKKNGVGRLGIDFFVCFFLIWIVQLTETVGHCKWDLGFIHKCSLCIFLCVVHIWYSFVLSTVDIPLCCPQLIFLCVVHSW